MHFWVIKHALCYWVVWNILSYYIFIITVSIIKIVDQNGRINAIFLEGGGVFFNEFLFNGKHSLNEKQLDGFSREGPIHFFLKVLDFPKVPGF